MDRNNISIRKCLELFPLRIAVTDYCNLKCFFCSNEGMPLLQRNKKHIDLKKLKYLIKVLTKRGLKNVSITGGEPTVFPKIGELMVFLGQFSFKDLFFHTNGINLNKNLLEALSNVCNKIAVSIHTVNFATWQKVTNGQRMQFNRLMKNLRCLSELTNKVLVELKFVNIKGYNDSEKEFRDFVSLCSRFGFKFKFLNFEPIFSDHVKLSISFDEVIKKLINISCKPRDDDEKFRGQSNYLPIKKFIYKNTFGVAIEIGCGELDVCKECYQSNEIFITPKFTIKPCHMNSYEIPLDEFILNKDEEAIYNAIVKSRVFLSQSPGVGLNIWQNNSSL